MKTGIYAYTIIAQAAMNIYEKPELTEVFWNAQKDLHIPEYKFML